MPTFYLYTEPSVNTKRERGIKVQNFHQHANIHHIGAEVNKLAYRELQRELLRALFTFRNTNVCEWLREQQPLERAKESARNQFISINLSKHLYRPRFLSYFFSSNLFGYVHFYFYNQFRVWALSGLRSSSFLSLFFDLIKRICFMSILIELLGDWKRREVRSWLRLLLHFLPSPSPNPIVPIPSLLCASNIYLLQMRFYCA